MLELKPVLRRTRVIHACARTSRCLPRRTAGSGAPRFQTSHPGTTPARRTAFSDSHVGWYGPSLPGPAIGEFIGTPYHIPLESGSSIGRPRYANGPSLLVQLDLNHLAIVVPVESPLPREPRAEFRILLRQRVEALISRRAGLLGHIGRTRFVAPVRQARTCGLGAVAGNAVAAAQV